MNTGFHITNILKLKREKKKIWDFYIFLLLGWYTTIINMNSFGKIVRSKRFMAPDGRFCSSRDEAIKYMLKEGLYDDSELNTMEAGYEEACGYY